MAEYMIFPERAKVHKVPENVIAKHAAFVEPLACSIHGVELGNIQFNDVVVISGCGPIGLGMVAAASLKRFWVISSINPNWHELWKQEKCSSLAPPIGIFKGLNELDRVSN